MYDEKVTLTIMTWLVMVLSGCAGVSRKSTDNACIHLVEDLRFVHQQIQLHSSNYNYSETLRTNADAAFSRALSSSSLCNSMLDYFRVLKSYVVAYRDPHLNAWTTQPLLRTTTGVIVRKLNDGLFVWNRDNDPALAALGLKRGDKLVNCDGQSAESLLNDIALRYVPVTSIEAAQYHNTSNIFARIDKTPGETAACEFERDGQPFSRQLLWKPLQDPQSHFAPLMETYIRPRYLLKVTPWGHWVGLGSLATSSDSGLEAMKQFIRDAVSLRKDRAIVLDLRGNRGGDSSWGDRWIEALYGYVPEMKIQPALIWASRENREHFMRHYETALKRNDPSEERRKELLSNIECLSGSSGGFISCSEPSAPSRAPTRSRKTKFTGKLFVLTDAWCLSSCEIFLERLKRMPRVTHVGIATDASTKFGDVRTIELPSGLMNLQIPMKVFFYSNRLANSLPIIPEISLKYDLKEELRENGDSLAAELERLIAQKMRPGRPGE